MNLPNDRQPDMHDPRANPYDQINSICESFAETWAPPSGEVNSATLAEHLHQVDEDDRPTLLRNLLHLELERRRANGQQPQLDEYLDQLPMYGALIRQVFLHSSSASQQDALDVTATLPLAQVRHLGDYRIVREIGRGGMGFVFEAVHLVRGNRVALKTLPVSDGPELYRFKREFRSIADVNHPNLVGLHELESDGSQWFITMELVDGTDFASYVRPHGTLDESRLRQSMTQLVKAVMALHAQHIIHRDLKPSNVMVTHDGRVIVLDFGLALELEQMAAARSATHIVGTPAYMAPEQAAGARITGACDWYAVGIMLYEALSGKLPFTGRSLNILQQKQQQLAPQLSAVSLPDDLCTLASRLIATKPEDRPDALEIAAALSVEGGDRTYATEERGHTLVGRERQLGELNQAFDKFQERHQPIAVFISGRSGEGKTALGTDFIKRVQKRSAVAVMSGRCYDRESMPFKALDSLIDALCSYLRSLPDVDAALLLPDDIGCLIQVFPVLNRVEIVAKVPASRTKELSDEQVRARAFLALRELLRRISSRTPIIWFIDDLQWGDADSAEVLVDVLAPPDSPAIMLIGTYRSDEADTSPFLASWQRRHHRQGIEIERRDTRVGPLNEAECHVLMVNELGRDDEVIRARSVEFARETRGNPFLLIELIGCFDPTTDSFEPMQMDEVLQRKHDRLPPESEPLLNVIAVSGQAMPLEEAAKAAGLETVPMSAISRMRSERLVRMIGSTDAARIDTYHDRIRETTLAHMDGQTRQSLHLGLARVIENQLGYDSQQYVASLQPAFPNPADAPPVLERVYDLAYHFDAAGEATSAWVYALLAAEQARRQRSTEAAAEQYAIASRNAIATAKQSTRYRIAEGFGESLMLVGQFRDATEQLNIANQQSADEHEQARIALLLGELAMKRSQIAESVEVLSGMLRQLGCRVPRSDIGFAIAAAKEAMVQIAHSCLPAAFYRSRRTRDQRSAMINQFLNAISVAYWFQSTLRLFWSHFAAMNAAERSASKSDIATVYSQHAIIITVVGLPARGQKYNELALEIYRECDDQLGVGYTHFFGGLGLFAGGNYRSAIDELIHAVRILEETGDPLYLNIGRYHIGLSHWMLGELDQAIDRLRQTFHIGLQLEDNALSHYTIDAWAKASRGKMPFQEAKSCFQSIPSDIQSTNQVFQAEGQWHLYHGRTEQAVHAFDHALDLLKQNRLFNWPTLPTVPSLVTSLRLHADAIDKLDPSQAEKIRRRALRIIRRASWVFRFFPTEQAYALREYALMLACKGATKKSLRVIEKSCSVAEKREEAFQLAESKLVRGRLRHELRYPDAASEIKDAEIELARFQSLIDAAQPERLVP